MAFLGFGNYNKPGPGVNKDDPQKIAPVRFFEILWRKLSKFIQANLLFVIPFLICTFISGFLFLFFEWRLPIAGTDLSINIWAMYIAPIPYILVSPFIGGLTYISRNFTREEHAFIWTDFMKATKSNAKYFLLNAVVTYIVYVLVSFSAIYYYTMLDSSKFFYVPLAICLMIGILFIFAQFYIPVMFITFDLTFRQVYKNAFIFSALGIGRNFMLLAIFVALILVLLNIAMPLLAIILILILAILILFAFFNYLITFTVYPVIQKYLIDPYNNLQNDGEEQKEEHVVDDGLIDDDDDDNEDGYVYINGRLVKKSDADKYKQ